MPQDPLPHPSSSPHHQVPGGPHRAAGVPFPSGAGPGPMSPPIGSGVATASAGLGGMSHDPNTPPKAPAVNKLGGRAGGPQTTPKDTIPLARTPRKQRSSRVHVDEKVELQRLPGFLGTLPFPDGPAAGSKDLTV